MLRSIIVSVSLLFTVSSTQAATLIEICEDIFSSSERTRCLSASSQFTFFDPEALDVCLDIIGSSNQVRCVLAVGDRQYQPGVVRACGENIGSSQRIECLASTGRRYGQGLYPGGQCLGDNRQLLRRELDTALAALENGQYEFAYSILRQLYNRL